MPHPPLAVAEVGRTDRDLVPETIRSFERIAEEIADIKPDTIVLSSPHAPSFADYFHISDGDEATGDFGLFRAPQVRVHATYDKDLIHHIGKFCAETFFPAGPDANADAALDHGTMVPLYFINKLYTDYKLVRVGLSGLSLDDHFLFGKFIDKCVSVSDKKVVFIASGDLSHCQKEEGPYGYKPEGPAYDAKLMDTLRDGDLKALLSFPEDLMREAAECGHRSFVIMAGALDDTPYDIEVLSHEATFGVGYGFAIVHMRT